jgi:hypothetical protein
MNGWMLQWYLYVPALDTVMVAEEPGSMSPVSKVCPLSAVAVCAVLSWLATVTRAPRETVIEAGANLKFAMLTEPVRLALDEDEDEDEDEGDPPDLLDDDPLDLDDEEPPDCEDPLGLDACEEPPAFAEL